MFTFRRFRRKKIGPSRRKLAISCTKVYLTFMYGIVKLPKIRCFHKRRGPYSVVVRLPESTMVILLCNFMHFFLMRMDRSLH